MAACSRLNYNGHITRPQTYQQQLPAPSQTQDAGSKHPRPTLKSSTEAVNTTMMNWQPTTLCATRGQNCAAGGAGRSGTSGRTSTHGQ